MDKLIIIIIGVFLLFLQQLQGQIHYTEIEQDGITATHFNDVDFSDVDGDGDIDFVMAGMGGSENFEFPTYLYLNDGTGNYSKAPDTNFPQVFNPSIVFVDIDGDDNEDLYISGTDVVDDGHNTFFKNDGTGNFTRFPSNILSNISPWSHQAAFSDIDHDGDQDLCLIGGDFVSSLHAKLYFNDGTGNFTEDTLSILQAVEKGTVDFIDIDNDGDQDLLITGRIDFDVPHSTMLYENDGTGKFELLSRSNLRQFSRSAVACSDIDGDGDQDFVISGKTDLQIDSIQTVIYKNNGDGVFIEMNNTDFDLFLLNSLDFGDIDGDGDEDLLVSGSDSEMNVVTKLYENDGKGNFLEILDACFEGISRGTVAFEELSGDNNIDILFSGWNPNPSSSSQIIKVYEGGKNEERTPKNSLVKSYTFLNNKTLNVGLCQNYNSIDVMAFNILGQQLLSEKYNNIDHFTLDLESTMGLQFIVISTNNEEIEVIQLLK